MPRFKYSLSNTICASPAALHPQIVIKIFVLATLLEIRSVLWHPGKK